MGANRNVFSIVYRKLFVIANKALMLTNFCIIVSIVAAIFARDNHFVQKNSECYFDLIDSSKHINAHK